MIFVDTGAWFASVVTSDPDHRKAVEWTVTNRRTLLTTDYVIDETLTLLRARGERLRAIELGSRLFDGSLAIVHRLTIAQLKAAWDTFREFDDKDWSFTDCTSKVVMADLRNSFRDRQTF